jgi:hypothetical protein
MLSRIQSNGFIRAVLALSLVLASVPYQAFADEKDELQKQMESIGAAPAPHAAAPAAETQPPTTVAEQDKQEFEQKDESKGLYETFVGENGTPLLWMAGLAAAYEAQRLYFTNKARGNYQRDLMRIRSTFPSTDGKPSVPPALAKQLEKIEALEKRMSGNLGKIQSRDMRIQAQSAFGDEICRERLGMLAKARETARPLRRLARSARGGATTPQAEPTVPAGTGTSDEALLDAIRADQKEYAQRYDEWRGEIAKYNDMVRSLSAETAGAREFKLPPPSGDLMKVAGVEPDHRAMRDAINRVNRFFTRLEERAMQGGRPIAPVRAGQAVWNRGASAANSTMNALGRARQMTYPSNWPGMATTALRNSGAAIASGARGLGGAVRHPLRTLYNGYSGVLHLGGQAGNFLNNMMMGTLNFVGRNSVRVALLSATIGITTNINSRLNEKETSYAAKYAALAAESHQAELEGRAPDLDYLSQETFIFNTTEVWRQLNEKKIVQADPKANPFLPNGNEGDVDLSPEAVQNMANARAEVKSIAMNLDISEFEALWVAIYAQGIAAKNPTANKAEERPALLQQIYADHKAEIQPLAVETEASARVSGTVNAALKAKDAEIKALKDAEVARQDAEKKLALEKAKAEEAERAAAAAKHAEAAKSKPPGATPSPDGTPAPASPAPAAAGGPAPEAKPATESPTPTPAPQPKAPSIDD